MTTEWTDTDRLDWLEKHYAWVEHDVPDHETLIDQFTVNAGVVMRRKPKFRGDPLPTSPEDHAEQYDTLEIVGRGVRLREAIDNARDVLNNWKKETE